jgi:hypothetical protein
MPSRFRAREGRTCEAVQLKDGAVAPWLNGVTYGAEADPETVAFFALGKPYLVPLGTWVLLIGHEVALWPESVFAQWWEYMPPGSLPTDGVAETGPV